jgi:hypothetical protein
MTHNLRFFDDYGSGWLWAGDEAALAAFGVGPLDGQLASHFSTETAALADHLLDRSAASLNPDYPPDGCPWPLGERLAFDLAADGLLARMRVELGAAFQIEDHRTRLAL